MFNQSNPSAKLMGDFPTGYSQRVLRHRILESREFSHVLIVKPFHFEV